MKGVFFVAFSILWSVSFSQRPYAPKWGSNIYKLTTAKFSEKNPVTKKYSPAIYKDATILLEDANDKEYMKLTMDIPDKFYIKEVYVRTIKYERSENGDENFSYLFFDDVKMVSLTFFYHNEDFQPYQILVGASDNYESKSSKTSFYILSEIKN